MDAPALISPAAALGRTAVDAYLRAARLTAPRCASLACGHAAEWTGQLFLHASQRENGPVAILSFPRLCSPHAELHARQHIAGQHFISLVSDLVRASLLPPFDPRSLEAEFRPI